MSDYRGDSAREGSSRKPGRSAGRRMFDEISSPPLSGDTEKHQTDSAGHPPRGSLLARADAGLPPSEGDSRA